MDAEGHRSRHVHRQPERLDQRHDRQAGLFVHPLRRLGLRHQLLHHLDVQVGPQRSRFALCRARTSPSPAGLADCAGATEIYGLFRSTFGFNEIFNTKAFTMGPLRNVSFEVGMDANTENNFLAPAKRDVVAGLQFAFDLPYKGYLNVAPLVYWEFSNHNAFTQCGLFGPGIPGTYLQLGRQRLVPADMGGRSQLLHGPRLPAAEHAVLLDQRPRRLVRAEGRFQRTSRAFRHRAGSRPPPRPNSTASRSV